MDSITESDVIARTTSLGASRNGGARSSARCYRHFNSPERWAQMLDSAQEPTEHDRGWVRRPNEEPAHVRCEDVSGPRQSGAHARRDRRAGIRSGCTIALHVHQPLMTFETRERMQLLAGEKRSRVALVTGRMRAIGTATGRGRASQLGRLGPDEVARVVHLVGAEACCVICGQVWAPNLGGEA